MRWPTGAAHLAAIDEAVARIRERSTLVPEVALILGTGLGAGVEAAIEVEAAIDYEALPHFPTCSVDGHAGRLLLGRMAGRPVVAMQGRVHYYEGHSLEEVTFPVRVMARLGATTLICASACGGMNPLYEAGDVVLVDDHINLLGDNPLIGPNVDALGPRFPDMSEPYDPELGAMAEAVALEARIRLRRGVYVAVAGPNLETRAEYRMLRWMGADVVGMSTVPEVIVARHMGMRVLVFAVITDLCFPDALEPTALETIIENAGRAEPRVTALVRGVLERLDEGSTEEERER